MVHFYLARPNKAKIILWKSITFLNQDFRFYPQELLFSWSLQNDLVYKKISRLIIHPSIHSFLPSVYASVTNVSCLFILFFLLLSIPCSTGLSWMPVLPILLCIFISGLQIGKMAPAWSPSTANAPWKVSISMFSTQTHTLHVKYNPGSILPARNRKTILKTIASYY